jgi:hypothetical protein
MKDYSPRTMRESIRLWNASTTCSFQTNGMQSSLIMCSTRYPPNAQTMSLCCFAPKWMPGSEDISTFIPSRLGFPDSRRWSPRHGIACWGMLAHSPARLVAVQYDQVPKGLE